MTTTEALRVGVVGLGIMGAGHLRTLAADVPRAQVAAVCDVDVARARMVAREGARLHGDPIALIRSDVEMAVARLTDFSQGATLRPLDLTSVIGLDGITLARRTGGKVSFGEDLRGRLVMKQQMADPYGTYLGPSSLDGVLSDIEASWPS